MPSTTEVRAWIAANTGRLIDRDGVYGAQAPDLVNAYAADLFGLPHIFGHGKDVAGNLARVHGWGEISPDQPAQLGDVFSEASGPANPYGYCGVVVADLLADLCAITQNADSTGEDPAAIRIIPKANVTGYARPPIEF